MTAGRTLRRLLVVVLVAAFVVACLRLGWWQWQRFGLTGSAQNLGYTLQWPVFAAFAVFMWWRLSKLEAKRRAELAQAAEAEAGSPAAEPPEPTESAVSPSAEPDRSPAEARRPDEEPDDELAAYNRYLARLHAEESDRAR